MVSLGRVKPQILMRARGLANRMGSKALDALMPVRCPINGDMVLPSAKPAMWGEARAASTSALLSGTGWSSLHFIAEPFCRRCGVPFSIEYGEDIECPACLANPPAYEMARSAIVYDSASHKLIVGFKHGDRTELALLFTPWLEHACRPLIQEGTMIVPVPLHRRRLLSRRYNQSALLAQLLATKLGLECRMDALVRTRSTPPQKDLSSDARQRNVAGAFTVPSKAREEIRDAHIVLIDDVLTTGATLGACALALSKAGAARVDSLTVARVVKGGIGAI